MCENLIHNAIQEVMVHNIRLTVSNVIKTFMKCTQDPFLLDKTKQIYFTNLTIYVLHNQAIICKINLSCDMIYLYTFIYYIEVRQNLK